MLFGSTGAPLPPSSVPTSPTTCGGGNALPSPQRANLLCAIDTSIPNGGTWMGVNVSTGAFASVTNSPQCASQVFHLPLTAPSRIELSAASSSFDLVGYLGRVLLPEGARDAVPTVGAAAGGGKPADGDGCCGLSPTTAGGDRFPRPFLKFTPERSRGCIVGEYLSDSKWEGSDDRGAWESVIPTNIVAPSSSSSPSSSVHGAGGTCRARDLFFDGYNLICGNLIGIAESLRRGSGPLSSDGDEGAGGFGDGSRFLYSTNRQHPFPLSRRARTPPSERRAPAYSATWAELADREAPPLDAMPLSAQPSLLLGHGERTLRAKTEGCEELARNVPRLTVDTVANTFLNNPIEPKSLHLTASVRRTLEALFPEVGSNVSSAAGGAEGANSAASSSSFVADSLVPALAQCLCERPNYEIDISEPNGKQNGLLAIQPMAGLRDEEYKAAVESELSKKLPAVAEKLRKLVIVANEHQTQPDDSAASSNARRLLALLDADLPAAVRAITKDIMDNAKAMRPVVAEEEREVHRNVYTHLTRDAVGAGVFKTRTQTVAILEDLDDGAEEGGRDGSEHRYRLHYYLRDTVSHTEHAPWQCFVVDLPTSPEVPVQHSAVAI